MDVCVKVVLDQKEYDRLLEIERKYNQLAGVRNSQQHGAGAGNCACQQGQGEGDSVSLSQIIAENTAKDAVKRPLPGILPAITTPVEDTTYLNSDPQTKKRKKPKRKTTKSTTKSPKAVVTFSSLSSKEKEELGFPQTFYPWYYIGVP